MIVPPLGVIQEIYTALAHMCVDVWCDLIDSRSIGGGTITLSEESITDYSLLRLARRYPDYITTRKFNHDQESKTTGADWEWWFGENRSWFGVRVQAKLMSDTVSGPRYEQLHYVSPSGTVQHDTLVQDASRCGVFPIYVFYNYSGLGQRVTPPLCLRRFWTYSKYSGWRFWPGPYESMWGCTWAGAVRIHRDYGQVKNKTKDAREIISATKPLPCLIDPNSVKKLAEIVRDAVVDSQKEKGEIPDTQESLPDYVLSVLERDMTDSREANIERLDGIMIVSDAPFTERLRR